MAHHPQDHLLRRVTSSPNVSLETSQHVFEGAEKRLEIDFLPNENSYGVPQSFRTIITKKWQSLLTLVNCHILSKHSSEFFDSFVLSESSLFVYDLKIIIKTCGTTTLLECVPKLLQFAQNLHLRVDYVTYSRKSFRFPDKQLFPHKKFEDEIDTLNEWFEGEGFVMGAAKGEKYFLYLADVTKTHYQNNNNNNNNYSSDQNQNQIPNQILPSSSSDREKRNFKVEQRIEILMDDLDRNSMKHFKQDHSSDHISNHLNDHHNNNNNNNIENNNNDQSDRPENKNLRSITGIDQIIPNSVIKDHIFLPCGYSLNGHFQKRYWTIHVTPEDGFSYVSFETNLILSNYSHLIEKVLEIFKPNKFIISLFANGKGGEEIKEKEEERREEEEEEGVKDTAKAFDQSIFGFKLLCKSTYEFEERGAYSCYHYAKSI